MTLMVHGRDWFQHRPPPELANLPEEAVDAAGTLFRGARARVYHLLRIVAERRLRLPVGQCSAPPGRVPRHFLVEPWSGGASGDRRCRELTEHGFHVEHEAFEPPNGAGSATMLYWLALPSSVPAPSGELSEFTFYTAIGDAIQVGNYGGGRRLTEGFIVVSCAGLHDEEAYRQRLLGAWRSGELVRQLAPMPQAVFYLRPEDLEQLGFDPIPMLRRALTSPTLGAIDLGHLDFSVEGHR